MVRRCAGVGEQYVVNGISAFEEASSIALQSRTIHQFDDEFAFRVRFEAATFAESSRYEIGIKFRALIHDRRGVTSAEYALLLVASGYRLLGKSASKGVAVAGQTLAGQSDARDSSGGGLEPTGGGTTGGGDGVVCDGRSCGLAGGCFVAGTLIARPRGRVPSRDFTSVISFLSRGEFDDAVSARAIATTYVRPGYSLVDVNIETADGARETVRSTLDHLYVARLYGWVAAADLVAGETLTDSAGGEGSTSESALGLPRTRFFSRRGTSSIRRRIGACLPTWHSLLAVPIANAGGKGSGAPELKFVFEKWIMSSISRGSRTASPATCAFRY